MMTTQNTPNTQVSGKSIFQNAVDRGNRGIIEGPELLKHKNPRPNVVNRIIEQEKRFTESFDEMAKRLFTVMTNRIANRIEGEGGILTPQDVTTCRVGFTPGSTVLNIDGYDSMEVEIPGISPIQTNIFDLNSGRYTVTARVFNSGGDVIKTIEQNIIISMSNVQSGARTIYINNL